jgi:hypothetical protein
VAVFVRKFEDYVAMKGILFSLFVIPTCLVLLLGSFASESQVRHFVTASLSQEISCWKAKISRFQLCRLTTIQPME